MKKKLIGILLLAVMTTFIFGGCGQKDTSDADKKP